MKNLNLSLIVSAATLLVSSLAQAEVLHKESAHQQNFISKRPYHQPVVERATPPANDFEGATLVRDEVNDAEIATQKQQQLMRLNQLSKRPY